MLFPGVDEVEHGFELHACYHMLVCAIQEGSSVLTNPLSSFLPSSSPQICPLHHAPPRPFDLPPRLSSSRDPPQIIHSLVLLGPLSILVQLLSLWLPYTLLKSPSQITLDLARPLPFLPPSTNSAPPFLLLNHLLEHTSDGYFKRLTPQEGRHRSEACILQEEEKVRVGTTGCVSIPLRPSSIVLWSLPG